MNVFISYARENRDRAAQLAAILAERGLSVWWDFNLRVGTKYREMIALKLTESHKVIVLWSEHAIESSFVIDEAQEAKDAGKLLPVSIDGSRPPLGFRDLHTIEATSLVDSVEEIIDAIQNMEAAPKAAPRTGFFRRKRRTLLFAAIAIVLTLLAATASIYLLARPRDGGQAGYTEFTSRELGINGVFPRNTLSLDDRQRKQQLLLFRDGNGTPIVKMFRTQAAGEDDPRAAQTTEVANLESQGYVVTSTAPQLEKNWSNWYVITGLKSGTVFYYRRWYQGDTIFSVEFAYPQQSQHIFSSAIERMTKEISFTR